MAYDKLVDSAQLDADLTSVANAIRTKSGTSSQLSFPNGFVSEINNISPGLQNLDDTYFGNDPTVPQIGSTDSQNYEDIADAINTALSKPNAVTLKSLSVVSNGTVTAPAGEAYDTVEVNVGGTENDVNFYDYDGTIVASYTATDFANLTEMPANPDHTAEGLTAQGWNWSLVDAKAYVADTGMLDVGQMYVTTDGKTRVHIHLEDGRLSPRLGFAVEGTVVVDWGDGSPTETVTSSSSTTTKYTPHTYASAGDYVITLDVTGTIYIQGSGNASILLTQQTLNTNAMVYQYAIKAVELGDNVVLAGYAISSLCLDYITIPRGTIFNTYAFYYSRVRTRYCVVVPDTVTVIPDGCFRYNDSVSMICLPSGVTGVANFAFSDCGGLKRICLPSLCVSIGNSAVSNCHSLEGVYVPAATTLGNGTFSGLSVRRVILSKEMVAIAQTMFQANIALPSITIPDSVTSINSSAFQNCYSLGYIKFKSTTPPTVAASNAFTNVPADCKIYVPTGTKATYEAATNYPNPATYTYVEY